MSTSPYARSISTRATPQREPIPGRTDQHPNSEGGYVFAVGPIERLRRFLILGSEGGSYYADEDTLTRENMLAIKDAIDELGVIAVREIVAVSDAGRAPKNDPALVALAIASAHQDEAVRQAALAALPKVARIGTHLYQFATFVELFRGWGPTLRRAVGDWYLDKAASRLAYDAIKYRQRDGWSHRDLLRLSHPVTPEPDHRALLDWILRGAPEKVTKKLDKGKGAGAKGVFLDEGDAMRIVEGFERAQRAETPAESAALIRSYGLPREAIKTEHLNSNAVWIALLDAGMPMTALVRNLATMTRNGLLTPMGDWTSFVAKRLADTEALKSSRIHPLNVLNALMTYQSGRSERGSSTWSPVGEIVDALDEAFYRSFEFAPKAGVRWMLAVDVSGSMDGRKGRFGHFQNVAGMPNLSPREAAMAMAMVAARSGDPYEVVAFSAPRRSGYEHYDELPAIYPGLSSLPFTPRKRLDDVVKETAKIFPGGTDASLPMLYAAEHGRQVDVFVVYTDSETWAGGIHPKQALDKYRETMGIDAKLICVNFVSNDHSIADPTDAGMLDVVGFDSAAPALMHEFAVGFDQARYDAEID